MLFAQSYPAHEIIVVDQTPAPDENTRRALEIWHEQGKIRWLRQTEPNASLARNNGAIAATGEVLLFLDDDIRVGPEFVASHARNYSDTQVTAVSGQILDGECNVTQELPASARNPHYGWLHFPKNYGKRCTTTWMASGNFSVRRVMFLALGGMDANYKRGAYREESDFAMRFVKAGYRFQFDPVASIVHLGASVVRGGGCRSWNRNSRLPGWEYWIGDWYFTFGHASPATMVRLLRNSLRSFVFNRYTVTHPWWIPILFLRWLAAAPVAATRRMRGPKLITRT